MVDRVGNGNRHTGRAARALARALAVMAAASVLAVAGPGLQSAQAAAPCAGRLAKSLSFATGQLRVYQNGQHVCAVTLARNPGARRPMSVSLQVRGGRPETDSGNFTRQAGPVTVPARGRCVKATGSVSGTSRSTGWILC